MDLIKYNKIQQEIISNIFLKYITKFNYTSSSGEIAKLIICTKTKNYFKELFVY
jgi:hypothetical protein